MNTRDVGRLMTLLGDRRSETLFPWLLGLLVLGYVALYWSQPLVLALDSAGYLNFSEHRTAGYPIFLWAVDALFGSTDGVARIQLVIAAAAFAFLGWSIHRAFRAPLFALAAVMVLLVDRSIADLHGRILTESIFISLMCLMTGSIAFLCHRPSLRWAAVSALACGLAITVRPAGLSLLVVWPVLLWLMWPRFGQRRIATTACVVVPIALCLLGESIVWHAWHDTGSRPNRVDRHLFAKALIIESAPLLSDPELDAIVAMGRDVMAPARALIADAPGWDARALLLAEFEVTAQHETYGKDFSPAVRDLARQRGLEEHGVLAQMARPAMLSEPVAWAGNAMTHYLGLWARAFTTPAGRGAFQSYIDATEPNALFERTVFFRRSVTPRSWFRFGTLAVKSIAILGILVAAALAVWQRLRRTGPDDRLVVAAIGALAVHSHLLFVGTFGVMVARYTDAMAPMAVAAGALFASWIVDRHRRRWSKVEVRDRGSGEGEVAPKGRRP